MGAPAFWDNQIGAQKHIAKVNGLRRTISGLVEFNKKLADMDVMLELVEAAEGAEVCHPNKHTAAVEPLG